MTAFSITIPAVLVLPFCIWPVCWMLVRLAQINRAVDPERTPE